MFSSKTYVVPICLKVPGGSMS